MPSLCASLALQAARNSEQPTALVYAAVRGAAAQLRHVPADTAAAQLQVEMHKVAEAYGARSSISPEALKECVRLILSKFGGIGIHEIREAYRMKAAGELRMPKGKGEMWGGEWNASQLGEVLAAYMEHRRAALSAYNRLLHEIEEEKRKAEVAERQKAEFLRKFPERVAQVQAATDWREVPEYIFDKCLADGLITFAPGEAHAILEDARELARIEHEEEIAEAIEAGKSLRVHGLTLFGPTNIEGRAKAIARKLSLFRKLKKST